MGFIAVKHQVGEAVVSEQAFAHLEKKGWKRVDAKAEPATSPAEVPAPKTKEA